MDRKDLLFSILQEIKPSKMLAEIELGSSLIEDLGFDSLRLLYLSIELEQKANFDLMRAGSEVDFSEITTVEHVMGLLERYQK